MFGCGAPLSSEKSKLESEVWNPKRNTLNGEGKRKRKGKGCYGRG